MNHRPDATSALDGAVGAVVILSANPIHDTGGGQRSAQLALEFLVRGYAVLFISHGDVTETVDLRLSFDHPRLLERKLGEIARGAGADDVRHFLDHPSAIAIGQLPLRPWLRVMAWARRRGAVTVYDLIDEWDSELGYGWYRKRIERPVAGGSDVLLAVSPALHRYLAAQTGRPVTLLPNAYNDRIFREGQDYERPADLPMGPVAIYVGSIWGGWIDWGLVDATARAIPDVSFVLIGDHRGEGAGLPTNCHFLGLKAQRDLPPYLRHATVGLLPWNTIPMTQGASPLKIYEYLAMGLRVISPDLEPVTEVPGVVICRDRRGFAEAVREAAAAGPSAELREQITAFALQQCWPRRVETLLELVDAARRRPRQQSVLARLHDWARR